MLPSPQKVFWEILPKGKYFLNLDTLPSRVNIRHSSSIGKTLTILQQQLLCRIQRFAGKQNVKTFVCAFRRNLNKNCIRDASSTFIQFQPFSAASINFDPIQSNFIHFHPFDPLSSNFIHFHPHSSNFVHFHSIPSTFRHFHQLSSNLIHYHPLSPGGATLVCFILPWNGFNRSNL